MVTHRVIASHMSRLLMFGWARNSAKVSPSQYRALVIIDICAVSQFRVESLTNHVDVNDPVLLVGRRDRPEAEAEVEILQPSLCGDFDGLAWHQRFDTPQGFSHQLLAEPGAAHFRRGHHATHV